MANKIQITIDLTRIDKNRINTRTYTNKEGQEVTVKEYVLDVVELENPKTIKEGDTWTLQQTHFVADAPTKEERANKTKMKFIGKGTGFVNKTSETVEQVKKDIASRLSTPEHTEEDWADEIPF
jgi:single-stranded DNA-binding protein